MTTVDLHLALASEVGACAPGARFDPDAPAGFTPPPGLALPDLPDHFALVHMGTARPEKFWYPDRWARVIEHLVGERGLECVVSGSGMGYEANHLDAVKRACRVPFADLSGRLTLLRLAAVAARARVVLAVDSAAAHLAAAVRAPQVTLFGPTNPFHWAPRHRRALTVTAAGDRLLAPVAMAPRAPGAPMRGLSTATVIRATGSLLAP
jgi:ADP-heptose:LPS heptosyltransferase